MAQFRVLDKNDASGVSDYCYSPGDLCPIIEGIVGDKVCPANEIPYWMEVACWAELATYGDVYETADFVVICEEED